MERRTTKIVISRSNPFHLHQGLLLTKYIHDSMIIRLTLFMHRYCTCIKFVFIWLHLSTCIRLDSIMQTTTCVLILCALLVHLVAGGEVKRARLEVSQPGPSSRVTTVRMKRLYARGYVFDIPACHSEGITLD